MVKNKLGLSVISAAALIVVTVFVITRGVVCNTPQPQSDESVVENGCDAQVIVQLNETTSAGHDSEGCNVPFAQDNKTLQGDDSANSRDFETENERREAEAEKLVNDFDALTDKWMGPSPKGVSMSDVDNFAKAFRRISKARRDECIHRALNLIPDENVMLLAGVLMDKTIDKEIVETVYNDILNRSEDVKKPILQEIFKDKTHPCWADTAWILDVTGELPKKN